MPAFPATVYRSPPALAAFAFPVLVLVGNKLLAGGLILLAVAILIWRRPRDWRGAWPVLVVLGLIAAWGAVSAAWSIAPGASIERAIRFAGLAICGVVVCMSAADRRGGEGDAVAAGLLAGLAVAAVLAVVGLAWREFVGRSFLDVLNYKPFATVAAVLLFPAAGSPDAAGRARWVITGGVALTALFVWSDSLAALVAVIIGALAFGIVRFGGRRAAWMAALGLAFCVVAVPAFVAWSDSPSRISDLDLRLRQSTTHRAAVWDFVGRRILDRPVLGWGMGIARRIPGAAENPLDQPRYRDMLLSSGISAKAELRSLPLHPHNAVLHTWLELGLVGLMLYLALIAICVRSVIRRTADRIPLATGMATASAAVVVGQVSFSVWQSWWIAAQFLAAAIVLAVYRSET